MIKREWLLGIGLISGGMLSGALLPAGALTSSAAAQSANSKIGAVGAVNVSATGQPQGGASQTLFVGADVFQNQTVRTDTAGLADIMFADESTITVGHSSEVVLDAFVYDPNNQVGQLAVGLSQGTMRFIGGHISKTSPVRINAPQATMTIRGGIGLFSFPPGQPGLVVFLYGDELTAAGKDGVEHSIRRPGFGFIIENGVVTGPFRVTDQQIAALRLELDNPTPTQNNGIPIDPLKSLQKFGSNDTFRPDSPTMTNDATTLSILNGTGVRGVPGVTNVIVDTTPGS
ncbi:MAG: FecR domain-containing protein [Dongiaceae bacterium]